MRKTFTFFEVPFFGRNSRGKIDIELKQNSKGQWCLSMTGNIGGNGPGSSSGQCYDTLLEVYMKAPRELREKNKQQYDLLLKLIKVWKQWHLNDTRAGTPRQRAALDAFLKKNPDKRGGSYYTEHCEYLKGRGLYEDNGYKYGTGWLYEPLPKDVFTWLTKLLSGESVTQSNTGEHISFQRQGSGGYYLSNNKDKHGQPLYQIYKVAEGWSARVLQPGNGGARFVDIKFPAGTMGLDKKTGCFDTLNNAKAAVNRKYAKR